MMYDDRNKRAETKAVLKEVKDEEQEEEKEDMKKDDDDVDVDDDEDENDDEDDEDEDDEDNNDYNDYDDQDDEDEDDEDNNDYDDYDDDQHTFCFESKPSSLSRLSEQNLWLPIPTGNLIICYDEDLHGRRMIVKSDRTNDEISNTIISANSTMKIHKTKCIWRAIDYALSPPRKSTLCAVFPSADIAQEIYSHFEKGKKYVIRTELEESYQDD